MADDCTTANPNHSKYGGDSISSLPDEILQHILSFIQTRFAIRTSVLSKRWRHVWYHTPSLSLGWYLDPVHLIMQPDSINEALDVYKAPKMASFKLITASEDHLPYIDQCIKFVMSRNVDKMLLELDFRICSTNYTLPDFFYVNTTLKELSVKLYYSSMSTPNCSVSWTSLKKLSLCFCGVSDERMAKILSGCPILESLSLEHCNELEVLDLTKSPSVRTLYIDRKASDSAGPTQIVAPHIHGLTLRTSQLPCTLVDVSSLEEAGLNICYSASYELEADFLQVMVLDMLDKLKNVEKLTFGENVLTIISLAEILHVPFPSFKVKYMRLETAVCKYVIPGLVRLLQNSPGLKNLTLHTTDSGSIHEYLIKEYLNSHGWNPEASVLENISSRDPEPNPVALFLEVMLKNTRKLQKVVVILETYFEGRNFEDLLEMVPTISQNNNNVSIVLRKRNLYWVV